MKENEKVTATVTDGKIPESGGRTGIIPVMEKRVVSTYKAIEQGVVNAYRAVETGAVTGYKKLEDTMVDKLFHREGETLEQTRERLRRNG